MIEQSDARQRNLMPCRVNELSRGRKSGVSPDKIKGHSLKTAAPKCLLSLYLCGGGVGCGVAAGWSAGVGAAAGGWVAGGCSAGVGCVAAGCSCCPVPCGGCAGVAPGNVAPAGNVQTSTLRPGSVAALVWMRCGSIPLDLVRYVMAFCARCNAMLRGSPLSAEPASTAFKFGSCCIFKATSSNTALERLST